MLMALRRAHALSEAITAKLGSRLREAVADDSAVFDIEVNGTKKQLEDIFKTLDSNSAVKLK